MLCFILFKESNCLFFLKLDNYNIQQKLDFPTARIFLKRIYNNEFYLLIISCF